MVESKEESLKHLKHYKSSLNRYESELNRLNEETEKLQSAVTVSSRLEVGSS